MRLLRTQRLASRAVKRPWTLAAFVLFAIATASGQPTTQPGKPVTREASRGPVKASLTVDREVVTSPEVVTVTLLVEAEQGVEVKIPDMGETLGDFGVKETKELPASSDDTTLRVGRVYTLEPVLAGACDIPEIRIGFADRREKADGSSEVYEDEVTLQPISIRVEQSLADVKGPASLPWPRSYRVAGYVLASLALLALAWVLARMYMRRRAARLVMRIARVVPAHEWALAELDILVSEGLVERGRVQEFYYRLNAIVRGYIERRWGLMAGEQTSEEFVRALQRSMFLEEGHKLVLRRFTDACDPVKYARQQPTGEEIGWVQTTAREFVVETAARLEPVEAKAA